ncbi:MAG: phage terminase small subunit P27 family [Candidatus Omnitrophica bacterium]|nr:phage terminase small subunit P27 family [Candidatus Omnitrophota bacterium]
MRGPKPKPTQLKIIQGNPGKRALNKNEPKPNCGIPDPPEHLSERALKEWKRIVPHLLANKLLTHLDMAALSAYCVAYGRWAEAELSILKTGKIIKTHKGNIIQSPMVGIANTAMLLMDRFGVQFGYTPSARVRLSVEDSDDTDEMAEFLKRATERKEVNAG